MDLLLVAAKRDEINDYAQLARDAKLKPQVVDIDAFTIQNVFEFSRGLPADQTFALINVGASLSSLNIVSRGVSAFTRDITNGGNFITEEIRSGSASASSRPRRSSAAAPEAGPPPPQVHQIIEGVIDAIAGEIQRSLDFFMATSGEAEIARIFLTGGTAKLPLLAQAIERRSRLRVEVFSPLEKIARRRRLGRSRRGRRAGRAARRRARARDAQRQGEALVIRVNLLPQKREIKRTAGDAANQSWLLVVLGVVVVEIVGLFLFHQVKRDELAKQKRDQRRAHQPDRPDQEGGGQPRRVKAQLEVLRAREDAIAKLQAGAHRADRGAARSRARPHQRRGPTVDPDVLAQLRRDNPTSVYNPGWDPRRLWLTSFTESDRLVKIDGLARDGDDVSELARRLSLSVYFADVKLLPGQQDHRLRELDVINSSCSKGEVLTWQR